MMRLRTFIRGEVMLVVVLLLVVGACGSRPQQRWRYDAESEPQAVVSGGVLYMTGHNHLHAVDAETGELLWKHGELYASHSMPVASGGTVYVISSADGSYLSALDALTGDIRWQKEVSMLPVSSRPLMVYDKVLYASIDGILFAAQADSGELIWDYPVGVSTPLSPSLTVADGVVYVGDVALDADTGTLRWQYRMGFEGLEYGNWPWAEPFVFDGVAYALLEDGVFDAVNAASGALLWQRRIDGSADYRPAGSDGVVCVGSRDGRVYALDTESGALLWDYDTGVESNPGGRPPRMSAFGGVVYVGSYDGDLYALDADTGELLWQYNGSWSDFPVVHELFDGVAYASSFNGNLYGLDAETGELVAKYATGGNYLSFVAVYEGLVYVGSSDGYMYAFEI